MSVVSDSVWPHRRQPTRLPSPWDSPGKNTGVGCHFLLQCMKVKMKVKSLSRVLLLATPWTAAFQAPPSMGFSRQEYWSGVPLPSPSSTVELKHSHYRWEEKLLNSLSLLEIERSIMTWELVRCNGHVLLIPEDHFESMFLYLIADYLFCRHLMLEETII